jgi:hypothetical protein
MEGWHEYNGWYIDMDGSASAVFSRLHGPRSTGLSGLDPGLGPVHRSTHDHRHPALRRSEGPACPRRVPPLLARRPMGHGRPVEAPDGPAGQNLGEPGNHRVGPGRYALSPLRAEGLWRRLVARCGSVHPDAYGVCLGLEPGGSDPAGLSSLGRRTLGPADPDAIASQRGRIADRSGPSDAPATGRVDAGKNLSAARRRLLRHVGRPRSGPHSPDQSDAAGCRCSTSHCR